MNYPWLFTMAWRDSRRNRSRLLLFMSSIVLGIAALVAINSFGDSMQGDIELEAKKLLGADLVVESRFPFSDRVLQRLDSLAERQSEEVSFASMVLFPKNDGSRLVQVRALAGDFPYYGAIETNPPAAGGSFQQQQTALADNTLMLQFDAIVGDSIKVGSSTFLLSGGISKVPGQPGIAATVAPPVYIPLSSLAASGLLQRGSRVNYKRFVKFADGTDVEALVEQELKPLLETEEVRYDTVEERKQEIGDNYANLTGFLNLVAFVALLLGCLGVASAVHIYLKEKMISVAILRCLGGQGRQGFMIFLIQIIGMGLVGSVLGALLGTAVQFVLPQVFAEFLPVEVNVAVSWAAVLQGVLVGVVISVLFALLPLVAVRKISPLRVIRASYEEAATADPWRYVIAALIVLLVGGFAYWQLQRLREALFFTLGMIVAFALLGGLAQLLVWAVRRYFPSSWSYLWRQSLSNLYRPNNQTLVLIVTVGLGTALISLLFFTQNMLLDKVKLSSSENQPNMVLFDIQTAQQDSLVQLARTYELPILQQVPVVTMRLEGLDGRTVAQIKEDTTDQVNRWVLNREYRATYRDSLIDSEELLRGRWVGAAGDSIFISLEDGLAESMQVDVGDRVTFNVQGAVMDTYVGSIRTVDWQRVQTNFLVVFPTGVLERAPQFHVLITRVASDRQAARFQQAVVKGFPNVSVIDLKLILQTIDEIIGKISFVIRFMAFFSIITGVIVLIGSVIISKYQRIQESVLLRTMGANRKQILTINALEYFFLGSLSALAGVFIALLGSWALARFSFEVPFSPAVGPVLLVYLIITALTMLIGLSNSRSILNNPPLEVLRQEA